MERERRSFEHPNVRLHFTPTYASWLNQVDAGLLSSRTLRCGVHRSIAAAEVGDFIAAHHAKATPFVTMVRFSNKLSTWRDTRLSEFVTQHREPPFPGEFRELISA